MIFKCNICHGQTVSHQDVTGERCFGCFQGSLSPLGDESPSEVSKSWDALLGKTDEELKEFCDKLAE